MYILYFGSDNIGEFIFAPPPSPHTHTRLAGECCVISQLLCTHCIILYIYIKLLCVHRYYSYNYSTAGAFTNNINSKERETFKKKQIGEVSPLFSTRCTLPSIPLRQYFLLPVCYDLVNSFGIYARKKSGGVGRSHICL